jgi:hypothetical protein
MRRLKKIEKGEYGYRNALKKRRFLIVSVLILFILAQLGARCMTDTQAVKNILTVMAILTVLPAANVASPLAACLKYRTPPRDFYDAYSVYEEKCVMLYDLVLTTKDDVLPMDAIAVHPTGIYAYCVNQRADMRRAEKALNEILTAQKLDPNMRVTNEIKTFDKRVKSLKPACEYEDDGTVEYAVRVLKSLSM